MGSLLLKLACQHFPAASSVRFRVSALSLFNLTQSSGEEKYIAEALTVLAHIRYSNSNLLVGIYWNFNKPSGDDVPKLGGFFLAQSRESSVGYLNGGWSTSFASYNWNSMPAWMPFFFSSLHSEGTWTCAFISSTRFGGFRDPTPGEGYVHGVGTSGYDVAESLLNMSRIYRWTSQLTEGLGVVMKHIKPSILLIIISMLL